MVKADSKLTGLEKRVIALMDGGAEVPMLAWWLYQKMENPPPLRPTTMQYRGVRGKFKTPRGEVTLEIYLTSLNLTVQYDFIVDDITEGLICDSGFMAHAGILVDHVAMTMTHRGLTVASLPDEECSAEKVRRITMQQTMELPANSRQLVPGAVQCEPDEKFQSWMVESTPECNPRKAVVVARSLCRPGQLSTDAVPVEIYNPSPEPVVLYRGTTIAELIKPDTVSAMELAAEGASPTAGCGVLRMETGRRKSEPLSEELQQMVDRHEVLTPEEKHRFEDLIHEYQDIFSSENDPLGRTDLVKHEIRTTGEPIKCRYRRTPIGLRDEVLQEEERMKEMGVIEPSSSPWASPVVMVRKKDGTLRYCIDYRRLNEVTLKDSYPLPNMEDCLDSLGGAKYFSTVDLSSGYWQVQMTDDAKDKTAFYGVGGGLWRFTVLPFGLCNAPATFERLMERVLYQLQWHICLCYLDDILIFSSTVTSHLRNLQMIFDRLRQAGLKLKPKKCQFFREKLIFLGHVVSRDGIAVDPGKVSAVADCVPPENVSEVRSILGLMGYYRRFIPDFSTIARPLNMLCEKAVPFQWKEPQEQAFRKLKALLTKAPLLSYPREEGRFTLDTDASDVGMGAVLSQEQDGEERVIAYGSKGFSKAERNYCTTRRELLAVVHFVRHYKHFLVGRKFLVRTDNAAVRYWRSLHGEATGQCYRWMAVLNGYNFDIIHRPGRHHSNADGLSRKPFARCAQCDVVHRDAKETKRTVRVSRVTRGTQTGPDDSGVGRTLEPQERESGTLREAAKIFPEPASGSHMQTTMTTEQTQTLCKAMAELMLTTAPVKMIGMPPLAQKTTRTLKNDERECYRGPAGTIEDPVVRQGAMSPENTPVMNGALPASRYPEKDDPLCRGRQLVPITLPASYRYPEMDDPWSRGRQLVTTQSPSPRRQVAVESGADGKERMHKTNPWTTVREAVRARSEHFLCADGVFQHRRGEKEKSDVPEVAKTASDTSGSSENSEVRVASNLGMRLRRRRGDEGAKIQPDVSWMGEKLPIARTLVMEEQLKDPACVDAMCWLQQGMRPVKADILRLGMDHKFLWDNFDVLTVEDGILKRKLVPKMSPAQTVCVVPPTLRKVVMEQCHATKTTGHFYFWKTLETVKRKFIWAGMSKDIQLYCRACQTCATKKTAGRQHRAAMRRYDLGLPMEEIAIDIMGPFPVSEKGNKYVLVVVDCFTKWMEAYPLPNIEASTVAETLLMEFFSRFGVPLRIKSDRGRQFECALFAELCSLLEVEHRMSTPFHPQGNSRVERMVKVVGNLLAAFCESQKQWDVDLPLLTLAYRSSVHEVTGFSPNYIMMGREVLLPLDIMMGAVPGEQRATATDYVLKTRERLEECFNRVRDTLKTFGERQTRYYDLRSHGAAYKPGDLVYLRNRSRKIGVSPKLSPKWLGPCLVLSKFGSVYEIQVTKHKSKMVHFDLLKPCYMSLCDLVPWLRRAVGKLKAGCDPQTGAQGGQ